MSRTLFLAALLLVATSLHAATPARESANGGGGVCPELDAQASAAPVPAASEPAAAPAAAAPTPATAATKPALARPRTAARWHSFVPGMFK